MCIFCWICNFIGNCCNVPGKSDDFCESSSFWDCGFVLDRGCILTLIQFCREYNIPAINENNHNIYNVLFYILKSRADFTAISIEYSTIRDARWVYLNLQTITIYTYIRPKRPFFGFTQKETIALFFYFFVYQPLRKWT